MINSKGPSRSLAMSRSGVLIIASNSKRQRATSRSSAMAPLRANITGSTERVHGSTSLHWGTTLTTGRYRASSVSRVTSAVDRWCARPIMDALLVLKGHPGAAEDPWTSSSSARRHRSRSPRAAVSRARPAPPERLVATGRHPAVPSRPDGRAPRVGHLCSGAVPHPGLLDAWPAPPRPSHPGRIDDVPRLDGRGHQLAIRGGPPAGSSCCWPQGSWWWPSWPPTGTSVVREPFRPHRSMSSVGGPMRRSRESTFSMAENRFWAVTMDQLRRVYPSAWSHVEPVRVR